MTKIVASQEVVTAVIPHPAAYRIAVQDDGAPRVEAVASTSKIIVSAQVPIVASISTSGIQGPRGGQGEPGADGGAFQYSTTHW